MQHSHLSIYMSTFSTKSDGQRSIQPKPEEYNEQHPNLIQKLPPDIVVHEPESLPTTLIPFDAAGCIKALQKRANSVRFATDIENEHEAVDIAQDEMEAEDALEEAEVERGGGSNPNMEGAGQRFVLTHDNIDYFVGPMRHVALAIMRNKGKLSIFYHSYLTKVIARLNVWHQLEISPILSVGICFHFSNLLLKSLSMF